MRALLVVVAVTLWAGGGAAQEPLSLASGDATVAATLYRGAGEGVRPTLLLLHGYPGTQQNVDLAEAARSAGWNAIVLNYRGSWRSTGAFSIVNALEDVHHVLALLRSPPAATQWQVDGTHIALLGHSMGGGIAVKVTGQDPGISCVAGLAPANGAIQARMARGNAGLRQAMIANMNAPAAGAAPAIRFAAGTTAAEVVDYMIRHVEELDMTAAAPALANRHVLLVAGSNDQITPATQHVQPLLDALRAAGAPHVTSAFLPADHNFTEQRARVAELVVGWLRSCL